MLVLLQHWSLWEQNHILAVVQCTNSEQVVFRPQFRSAGAIIIYTKLLQMIYEEKHFYLDFSVGY